MAKTSESVQNGTGLKAAAQTHQQWAELCRRAQGHEPAVAIQWYLEGMVQAFEMSAARLRQMADKTVQIGPSKDTTFAPLVKALLETMAQTEGGGK